MTVELNLYLFSVTILIFFILQGQESPTQVTAESLDTWSAEHTVVSGKLDAWKEKLPCWKKPGDPEPTDVSHHVMEGGDQRSERAMRQSRLAVFAKSPCCYSEW